MLKDLKNFVNMFYYVNAIDINTLYCSNTIKKAYKFRMGNIIVLCNVSKYINPNFLKRDFTWLMIGGK